MHESNTPSSSKRFCKVFQMTAKQRGMMAQTGSELGTYKYRQQHPKHPELVFNFYRKRDDGSYLEAWVLEAEMNVRHEQRIKRNLARARARGVSEWQPAAPKEERQRRARVSQEKARQKRRKKKAQGMTAEDDTSRWEVLALTMGVSVSSIRPQ